MDRSRYVSIGRAAVLAASVLALSGCHEVLRASLGNPDPPVHNPNSAGRSAPLAGAAASGRAFVGRADGQLSGRIKIRHGFVKSKIGPARFVGTFSAQPTGPAQPGDESLGPFESAQWHARLRAVRNRRTGKIKGKGLVLATFDDPSAGRACLRLGHKARRKQNRYPRKGGRGRVTVLGGEGGARTLAGTATARVKINSDGSLVLSGHVSPSQGPERGFTAACTKLEQRFGLQPL